MVYTYNLQCSICSHVTLCISDSNYDSWTHRLIVLGRKTDENYFADACTISKFSSYHIMYCNSGKIRTNASAMKREEPTQTITMTLTVNLAINYSTITRARKKKVFNRYANIVLKYEYTKDCDYCCQYNYYCYTNNNSILFSSVLYYLWAGTARTSPITETAH